VKIKLIGAGLSPFVRKVRVVMAEKGLEYEHDPMAPFGVSEEYLRMHPQGKIPTLVHGERVIPDSSAICTYLERIAPEPRLYPEEPYELARALWLEEFADAGFIEGAIVTFQERVLGPLFLGRPGDEARVEKALGETLPRYFDYLERELGDADYLVGGRFGIADIATATQLVNFAHGGGEVDAGRWPRLAGYVERVCGRPSFRDLIAEDRALLDKVRSRQSAS